MAQLTLQQAFELAVQHHQAGRLQQAEGLYRQILAQQPRHADALQLLGVVAHQMGRNDAAIDLIQQAIALKPANAGAYSNLGLALRDSGRLDEAIAAFRQTLALQPDFAEVYSNLANALRDKGCMEEAIAAYRKAVSLNPRLSGALYNFANVLNETGQVDEAIVTYRQAIALNPGFAEAQSNLGNALKDQWRVDQAIAAYRQSLALNPDGAIAHSGLLLAMHYDARFDAQAIAQEHRNWNLRHAAPLQRFIRPHTNDRNPERRLRIGYVSPDFRFHAVAPFALPLLAYHDRPGFQVFCYAHVARPDAMTALFRASADEWRSTIGLSDEQVANLIQQDQIDILVDLAGHTADNRLLAMARKPAPIQITAVGFPDTTGMAAVDYRLTDAHADPPGMTESLHSEQLIRVPRTCWVYQPPADSPPPDDEPIAAPITFGCFNHLPKITESMLRVWARILAAVPGARLLLKAKGLDSPDVRGRIERLFEAESISPQRVKLLAWTRSALEHLELYRRIAIGLDTFPYHGTTTTCEAMWMGVPVISLAGRTHVSRVGVSLLSNVGLADLVAQNPDEYVRLAVKLADDLPRLADLRAGLRSRMQQSALMDGPRFTRAVESAFRDVWRRWCGTKAQ